jgi:hypothetical protein
LTRQIKYGWDHLLLLSDETKPIQLANSGMTFEAAWRQAERGQGNPTAEHTTIGEAAKLVQDSRF